MQQHTLQMSYYKNAWLIYGVSTEKTTEALPENKLEEMCITFVKF